MSLEKRLEGKVALVTGGARGIGKAISARLAAEGAKLAIVDIMLDVAQATADEFTANGVEAKAYAANVAVFAEAEATVAQVVADFGSLDILVNNAGITRDTLMLRMTEDDFDKVIAVNLKGTFNFTKAAIRPMMKARAGKIINIASVVGRMGNVGQANYAATKAAMQGFTRTMAKELGRKNVRMNCVAPGYIDTDMMRAVGEEKFNAAVARHPMQRMADPDELAAVVTFLCTEDASWVTGQTIIASGGAVCL